MVNTHPNVEKVFVWHKKKSKIINLLRLVRKLRKEKYQIIYNLHRFGSSGILTYLSRAKEKIGFDKNPLSRFYTRKITHQIPHLYTYGYVHEVQRNLLLLGRGVLPARRPTLHPTEADKQVVDELAIQKPYFVLAPPLFGIPNNGRKKSG